MGVRPGRGVEVGGGVEDATGVRVAVAVGVTVSFGAGVDFEVGTSVGRGVAEAGALVASSALVADGIDGAVPSSLRRSSRKARHVAHGPDNQVVQQALAGLLAQHLQRLFRRYRRAVRVG